MTVLLVWDIQGVFSLQQGPRLLFVCLFFIRRELKGHQDRSEGQDIFLPRSNLSKAPRGGRREETSSGLHKCTRARRDSYVYTHKINTESTFHGNKIFSHFCFVVKILV